MAKFSPLNDEQRVAIGWFFLALDSYLFQPQLVMAGRTSEPAIHRSSPYPWHHLSRHPDPMMLAQRLASAAENERAGRCWGNNMDVSPEIGLGKTPKWMVKIVENPKPIF